MKPSAIEPVMTVAAIALTLFAILLAMWVYDVWSDRRHSVIVLTATPIFLGSGEGCGGTRMATASPNMKFRVKRIRYWKACATVDVALLDGRKGHIQLGDGKVSISPPLRNY